MESVIFQSNNLNEANCTFDGCGGGDISLVQRWYFTLLVNTGHHKINNKRSIKQQTIRLFKN